MLWERRQECPDAVPILAVHYEIVVECGEDRAEEVEVWLRKAMVDGMGEALAPPDGGEQPRVPVEVDVKVGKAWSG